MGGTIKVPQRQPILDNTVLYGIGIPRGAARFSPGPCGCGTVWGSIGGVYTRTFHPKTVHFDYVLRYRLH